MKPRNHQHPSKGPSENAMQGEDNATEGSRCGPAAAPQKSPELDARIQEAIGKSLSSHYTDLLNAPVPDRFLTLLAELDAKEADHES